MSSRPPVDSSRPQTGAPVRSRLHTAVALLLALTTGVLSTLVLAPVAQALEAPTAFTNGTSTTPSANAQVWTGTGATTIGAPATLGSRGYVAGDFTPALPTGQPVAAPNVSSTGCTNATGVCAARGTLVVTFAQPVLNPELHLAGLGGSFAGANNTQTDLHAVLALNGGGTLTKLSGGNLAVTGGNTITTTNPDTAPSCSTNAAAGGLAYAAVAGCGSVQVNTPTAVSSLTFTTSLLFTANPNGAGAAPAPGANGTAADAFNITATLGQDYGDAPASYAGNTQDAARHVLSDLRLGQNVTEDNANVVNGTAPINTGNADADDAITGAITVGAAATTYSQVVALSGSSKASFVSGWIDFDGNGTFDAGERSATATPAAGATSVTLQWTGITDSVAGPTWARFRTGYTRAQVEAANGAADSGEVEDWPVTITGAATGPTSGGACAPVNLPNGSFETPTKTNAAFYQFFPETTAGIQWQTSAADGNIEYWSNGQPAIDNNNGIAISAHGGTQWAEVNASEASYLYQDVATVGGQILKWGVWHRGRGVNGADGRDSMRVRMGSTTAQTAQVPTGATSATITDGPNGWVFYSGFYTVPAGQTTTRFGFQAVSTSSGNPIVGNFVDDVTLTSEPCVATTKTVTNTNTNRVAGVYLPGDTVQYTMTTTSTGGPASGTVLTDPVPANVTYVPGSLTVDGAARTDAADTDTATFANNTVTANLGVGATGTAGGTVSAGTPAVVTWRGRIGTGLPSGTTVTNTARASYRWDPDTTVLNGTAGSATLTTTTSAQAPLSCTNIYAVQGAAPRNVWQVTPTTGALTASGTSFGTLPDVADATTINALGITDGGGRAYGVVNSTADATVKYIQEINRTAGTQTRVGQLTIPAAQLTNVLMGAVNPRTGIYYFGGITGTTLYLYGFNTTTGTSLGLVASGTVTVAPTVNNNPGTNGDLAFDSQNNLYLLAAGTTQAIVQSVNQALPTTAVTTPTALSTKVITTITDTTSTNTLAVGLAAGGQGDRRLYVAGGNNLRTVNPSTGAIEATVPFSGAGTGGVNDLASCSSPNTIEGQVAFPDGRVAAGDQATTTITGGGISSGNTGTTTGTDTGLQDTPAETSGPVFGLDGLSYTVTQTGITSADYRTTYTCTDLNSPNAPPLAQGTGRAATFTMPSGAGANGTAAYCVFTNTVLKPAITLDKQVGAPSGITAGSTVPYSFVIVNTGNVDLASVSVSDNKLAGVTCPTGVLAVGATRTCTGTYTITAADVAAGRVVNSATATGVPTVSGLTAPNPTASDSVTLTVPRPPTAVADTRTTLQDVNVTLTPASNDTPGPDGAALVPGSTRLLDPATNTYGTSVTIAGQGTYTVAASGAVTFDPVPTFVGTATPITYRVADANGATATSTITITTTAVTPRANPDTRFTPYNTPVAVDVVANDAPGDASAPLVPGTTRIFDPATSSYGTTLVVANQGTYTVTSAGVITFTPLASFSGAASPVTYQVADDNGTTATSTLTVTVGTPPSSVPDTASTLQDVNVTVNPLANDTASQNGTTTPSSLRLLDPATGTYGATVTIPNQGTYTADAAGAVVFDPIPGFTGTATPVTYRATDSNNAVISSTITITVTPVTPTAVPDSRTTAFQTAITIPVLANDTAGDASAPLVPTTVRLLDPASGTYGTSVTVAGQGTYAVNATTGAVTFTPAAGFRGTATPVTYRVADDNGTTATATITVSVDTPAPPTATADSRTTPQGVAVTLSPSANDNPGPTGAAIDPTSVRLVNPATNAFVTSLTVAGQGTYAVNTATGAVTFTPLAAFTGAATSVGYRVADVNGATATSSISITVTAVTPTAVDDARTTPYETAVQIDAAANDTPGDPGVAIQPATLRLFDPVNSAYATSVTVPGQGSYAVSATGVVTFTPAAGFTGVTTPLTYRVADANGTTTTARITVTVALPPAPTARPDTATTPQNTDVDVSPLANDTTGAADVTLRANSLQLRDPATGTFAGSLVVAGQGTYTVNSGTGVVTFDPLPGFTGPATAVTYRVTDSTGQTTSSTITVTVTAVTPRAVDDTATTPATTAVTTAVLTNDVPGVPGVPFVPSSVVLTSANATNNGKSLVVAGQGTYTVGTDGRITFVPAAGFSGTATPVQYRVADTNGTTTTATYTVTVGAAPIARADIATTPQNVDVTVDPAGNDTAGTSGAGGAGSAGTLVRSSVVLTDPAATNGGKRLVVAGQGTYTVDPATGIVTFDPEPQFAGRATSIGYTITDSFGSTASSTITVTVTAVTPTAADDTRTTPYDTTITVSVLANDTSGGAALVPASVRLVDPATGNPVGTLTVAGQGVYTANNDGTVGFDPAVGFSGVATPVGYRVLDANGTAATALIRTTVGAAPVARPDTRTTPQDVTVVVSPLGNDTAGTDGAGGTGTLVATSVVLTSLQATNNGKTLVVANQGTWTVNADGTVGFDPLPAFTGPASGVDYAVTDSYGNRVTSTITVTVTPITPTAVDDRATTPNDVTVTVPVLGNDTAGATTAPLVPGSVVLTGAGASPDGKTLVVAGEGTWTVTATGSITFDPLPAFSGQTTAVGYRVSDTNGTTAAATVVVTVGAGPIARPDTTTTPQNTAVTQAVLTNDTPGTNGAGASGTFDPASVVFTGTGATDAGKTFVVTGQGTFRVTTSGTVSFTPVATFTGTTAAVPYRVTDSLGGTATSTVSVTVTPVTPTASDDTARTPATTAVTLTVLANDTAGSTAAPLLTSSVVLTGAGAAADGKSLTVTGEGTYVVDAAGTITFTPVAGFTGVTTPVRYRVSDSNGTTASALVTVTVGAAPSANPDAATTPQDVTAGLDPLANDAPGTGGTLTRTSVVFTAAGATDAGRTLVVPNVGTWTADPTTGRITFDPLPAFTGQATATYSVRDSFGNSAVSTVTFTVTPITPTAVNDARSTPYDTVVAVPVLANDTAGATTAPLRPASVVLTSTDATDGGKTLVVAGQGTYTVDPTTGVVSFDPLPTFSGAAAPVTYRVLDANGTAATATIRITVGAAPQARPDTATTPQDVTVALTPLANDAAGTDGAGGSGTLLPGSVVLTGAGAAADGKSLVVAGQGTWTVAGDGTVSFDPLPVFTGTTTPVAYRVTDSFGARATSTLTVTVTAITPVVNDDVATTPANTPVTIAVVGNDRPGASTAPLVPGSVLLTSPQATNGGKTLVVPGQGTWQVNQDGSITFTPVAGATGATNPPVQYSVADTNGTRGTAQVTVNVGAGPVARPDTASTPQNVDVTVPTVGNDTAGTGATLVPGSVVLTSPDATNAGRTLVTAEGTWTVSATSGAVTLDPAASFTGQASVTYAVRDTDGNTAASTVTVTVTPVTPTAADDAASTPSATPVTVAVLTNDRPAAGAGSAALVPGSVVLTSTDATNGGKSLTVVNQGTYTVATDGSITFTPVPGFAGPTSPVSYRVLDANGTPATAVLRVTVGAGPVAVADTDTTPQNVTVTVSPLTNDTAGNDGAGNASTFVAGSVVLTSAQATSNGKTLVVAGQGTYQVNADNTVTFDPLPGFTGTATAVRYRVTASVGGTATSSITITVTPLTPRISDDTPSGPAGAPLVIDVLGNDTPGAPSAPIDVTSVLLTSPQATNGGKTLVVPGQGTFQVNPGGTITFTPVAGFSGVTTPAVQYSVADANGTRGTGLISVTIGSGPVANPDTATTPQDVTVQLDPPSNDTAGTGLTIDRTTVRFASADATDDGRTLLVPGRGTFTADPTTGRVSFDPLPTTTGQVSATYRVLDSNGNVATSTITVTVVPITPDAVDDVATTPTDRTINVPVLGNDTPGTVGTTTPPLVPSSVVLTSPAAVDNGKTLVVANQGTYTVQPNGSITFDPVPGFAGVATAVTYRVADANGTTDTATLTVTVKTAPTAVPDTATTAQNVTVTINALGNDTAGGGATKTAGSLVLTSPAATLGGKRLEVAGVGVWTVGTDDVVTFDPEPAYTGTTAVDYRFSDSDTSTASSTITVTVTAVVPDARDDAATTPYDTTIAVPVLANDLTGTTGAALVPSSVRLLDPATGNPVTSVTVAGQGTWTANADGTVSFDPVVGFAGAAAPLTYRVADANGTTDTAVVRVTVSLPAGPSASPSERTTPQDITVVLDPLANDSAAPGVRLDPTSVLLTAPGATDGGRTLVVAGVGTFTVDPATGQVTFDPLPTYTGTTAAIAYSVADQFGQRASSTLRVVVTPITPVVNDDTATTPANRPVTIPVLTNDRPGDPSAPLDPTTVVLVGGTDAGRTLVVPNQGTFTVDPTTGAITFTPVLGFAGVTTPVRYRVADDNGTTGTAQLSVTVGAGPAAVADATTTPQDVTVGVDVLANDTAGAGGTLDRTSVVLTNPAATAGGKSLVVAGQGTWTVGPTGTVQLDPEPGFVGTASTTYAVTDSLGNTAVATVAVTVTAITPTANDDTATTPASTRVDVSVLGNDVAGATTAPLDPTTVVLTDAGATNGGKTLVVTGEGTYTVSAQGVVSFTPAAGFAGVTTPVTYRVADRNGTTTSARLTISVGAGPRAVADAADTKQDVTVSIPVLGNDVAGAGAQLVPGSVTLTSPDAGGNGKTLTVPGVGTWTVDPASGAISFDPEPGYVGSTSTTYSVRDTDGNTAVATVAVRVAAVVPTAADDTATTPANRPVGVAVLANDTAGDTSAPLVPGSVVLTSPLATNNGKTLVVAGVGTYEVGAQGGILFTPEAGFNGLAGPVTYRVSDDNGTTATAQLTITVGAAPTARPDTATTRQDETVVVDPLANDVPGTGASLVRETVQVFDPATSTWSTTLVLPGQGTLSVAIDGRITFDPLPGFTGTTSVTYRVSDSNANTTAAVLTLEVTPVTPKALDDDATTPLATPVTLDVLGNDTPGAASAPLVPGSVTLVGATGNGRSLTVPGEGTWTVDATTGALTFTPLGTFTGRTTAVQYRVLDDNGTAATASARVTVGAAPTARPDTATTAQDVTVVLDPLANDTAGTDGAGATGTLVRTSVVLTGAGASTDGRTQVVPNEGTWTVDATTGRVSFDPLPGFTGTTTGVAYSVTDTFGNVASSTLQVRVTAITPTVNGDTASTPAGTAVTVPVLANDTPGAASAPLVPGSVVLTDPAATNGGKQLVVAGQGTWTVNADGTLGFVPAPGFTGLTTPVQYRVADTNGTTGTALVQVTVGAGPSAVADTATTPQNTDVTVDVVANDTPGAGLALVPGSVVLTDPAATNGDKQLVVAGQGTWTVDATTGAVTFDPLPAFTGQASTTYAVSDSAGNAAVATVTVTVGALVPTARPDTGNARGGRPVVVPVLANDAPAAASAPLDPTSVVLVDPAATNGGRTLVVPGQGTWTVNPNTGDIQFVPADGFTGAASPVTYQVSDTNGSSATSTVTVVVGDRPVARPDLVSVPQGTTARLDPLTNDIGGTDGAGGRATLLPSTVTLTDPAATNGGKRLVVPGQGTWTVDPTTGEVTFVPVGGFAGDAVTPYSVTGSYGATATSTITVRVVPVTPSINDDTAASPAGRPVTITVLGNDTPGSAASPLVPSSVVLTDPAATNGGKTLVVAGQGTWQVNPDGTITFTPEPGFAGVTTPPVQYRVSDTNGTTGTGRVSVTVGAAPTAVADAVTTQQDVTVTLDPLANDTVGAGATLVPTSVVLTTPGATNGGRTLAVPGVGTWTVSATTGQVTFDPVPGFTGQASTTYSVTDTAGNSAVASIVVTVTAITPVALDDTATTAAGTPAVVTVLGNDRPGATSAALVPGSVVLTSPAATNGGKQLVVPGEGTWTVLADGTVRFVPLAGFTGPTTSVTYQVSDANGTPATAQVTVTVGAGPVGRADTATTTQNTTVQVDVLGNDSPAAGATLVPGSVVLTSPGATANGTTLVVAGVGTWTVNPDGTLSLDPLPGFTGATSTTYAVTDSLGNTAVATVTVSVTPVRPTAGNDTGSTPAATAVTLDVLANDTAGAPGVALQPGSVVLTAAGATNGGKTLVVAGEGTWTVAADGRITFTPLATFTGLATPVTYQVSDANGTTATASVTVSVGAAPTARPDTATTAQDVTVTVDPLANDSADAATTLDKTSVRLLDPATGTYQRTVTIPGQGTWTVDPATGVVSFDPVTTFTGSASITYQVADSNGDLAVSTIAVAVAAAGAPRTTNDTASTPAGTPVTIDVLANDGSSTPAVPLDPASVRIVDPVTGALVTTVTVPGQGTWTVNPDGTLTFTPLPGFTGQATPVTYSVADTAGLTSTATVTLAVGSTTVPPTTTPTTTPTTAPVVPGTTPTPTSTATVKPGKPGTTTTVKPGTTTTVKPGTTTTTTTTTGTTDDDSDGGLLPNTGGPALWVLGLGLGLLLAGAWVLGRRRRS